MNRNGSRHFSLRRVATTCMAAAPTYELFFRLALEAVVVSYVILLYVEHASTYNNLFSQCRINHFLFSTCSTKST